MIKKVGSPVLAISMFILVLLSCGTKESDIGTVDWPRWRGPNGDGISEEKVWNPAGLSGGPRILWRTNIGLGHSNVVVMDNRLYTMGVTRDGNTVVCLNAGTGQEIWRFAFESSSESQSTVTIDGDYVYALNVRGILLCLKARNGKLRWKKDLVSEYDVTKPTYGFAASPVIEGDLLVLTANNYGMALDKRTGELVWISEKPPKKVIADSTGPHYSTPVMYDYDGKRYSLISSYIGLHSVEVATGKVFWLYKWEPLRAVQTTDPLIFDKYVFITQYDEKYGSVLLEIEGGEPKVLWESMNVESNISSPVMIDGYVYGCEGGPYPNRGSLQCLDAKTGELMWEEKLNGEPISLMAADGKLIILDEKGTLYIAEATPSSYEETSSCQLPSETGLHQWWTPPVLCNGRIYCRNYAGDLVGIDVSK